MYLYDWQAALLFQEKCPGTQGGDDEDRIPAPSGREKTDHDQGPQRVKHGHIRRRQEDQVIEKFNHRLLNFYFL